MPSFTVNDDHGNTLTLEGDSPPTEQELEEIFAQSHPQSTSEFRGAPTQVNPDDIVNHALKLNSMVMGGLETGLAAGMDLPQRKAQIPDSLSLKPQFGAPRYENLMGMDAGENTSDALLGRYLGTRESTSDWNKSAADPGEVMGPRGPIKKLFDSTAQAPIRLATFGKEDGKSVLNYGQQDETYDEFGDVQSARHFNVPIPGARMFAKYYPEGRAKDIGMGAYNAAANLMNFFLSPQGAGLMVTALPAEFVAPELRSAWQMAKSGGDMQPLIQALRTPAGQAVSAGFAWDMAKHAPDALHAGDEAAKRGDTMGAVEGYLGGLSQLALAGVAGKHAVQPFTRGTARPAEAAEAPGLSALKPEEHAELKTLDDQFHTGADMSGEEMTRHQELKSRMESSAPERASDQFITDDQLHQQFTAEAAKHGYTGKIAIADESKLSTDDPLRSFAAQWNPKTRQIEVNKQAWEQMTPAERSKMIEPIASEEAIHSQIDDSTAKAYAKAATKVENWASRKIYEHGANRADVARAGLTDIHYAHELIRQDMQRLRNVKLTEKAASEGSLTLEGLDILYKTVQGMRRALRTSASESQIGMLDDIQNNIGVARGIINAQPQQEQSESAGSLKRNSPESIADDLGMEFKGEAKSASRHLWRFELKNEDGSPGTSMTAPAGSTAEQVRQKYLDKIAEYEGGPDAPRAPKQSEIGRVLDMSPDEFASWKRDAKLSREVTQRIADTLTPEMHDKVKAEAERLAEETKQVARDVEEGPLTEEKIKKLEENSKVSAKAQTLREISEDYLAADQLQAAGSLKRGTTKADERRMAELRKYRESMGKQPESETRPASGGEAAPVPQSERASAVDLGATPRPNANQMTAQANEMMAGEISRKKKSYSEKELDRGFSGFEELTGKELAEAIKKSSFRAGADYKYPVFKDFAKWAKEVGGAEPHQIRAMWQDSIWKHLLEASPERLSEWRSATGMERKYGRTKLAAPAPIEGFQLEGQRGPVFKKQQKESAQASQRYRLKVVRAVGMKLLGESIIDRPSVDRRDVTQDSVDYSNEKTKYGAYRELSREDISNPERLLDIVRDQARASNADPESNTRRLVAVVGPKGEVELLSTYNNAGVQMVTDPSGSHFAGKPNRKLDSSFLRRYRPIASVLLKDPVKGFRKRFATVSEYMNEFGGEAARRDMPGEFSDVMPPAGIIEGTRGIKGEGGDYVGPFKQVFNTRGPGEFKSESDITAREAMAIADEIFTEVGVFDSIHDAKLLIQGLIDRVDRGKELTKSERLAVNGYRKIFDSIERENPKLTDQEILDRMSARIYENHETAKNLDDYVTRTVAEFQRKDTGTPRAGATRPGASNPVDLSIAKRVPSWVTRPEHLPEGYQPDPSKHQPAELGRDVEMMPGVESGPEQGANADWGAALGDVTQNLSSKYRQAQINRLRRMRKSGQLMSWESAARTSGLPWKSEEGGFGRPKTSEEVRSEINQTADDVLKMNQFFTQGALRRTRAKSVSELVRNAMMDTFSGYDQWMADRIREHGGDNSKKLAREANQIVDRAQEVYGGLTALLDDAKYKAGGVSKVKIAGQVPNPKLIAGTKWLNGVKQVTPFAFTSRTVEAIEGRMAVPSYAQPIIDAAIPANWEIGRTVQPVSPGFQAGGKFQRNYTMEGYDVLQQGSGDMWRKLIAGTWKANQSYLATAGIWDVDPVSGQKFMRKFRPSDVEADFRKFADALADPSKTGPELEQINQDMARRYPNVITHIKHNGQMVELVHSKLFNYLERAARRAAAIRAIRERFPANDVGRQEFNELITGAKRELPPQIRPDVDNLVKALNGHPTDNYSQMGLLGPTRLGGQMFQLANQTLGHVAKSLVLSGNVFQQIPETMFGGSSTYGGYKNTVRAMARLNQLYPQMEIGGAVNRLMYDWSMNSNSLADIAKTLSRYTGNSIAKLTASRALNELQEGQNAALARVISERIVNNELTPWEKKMLPRTLKDMGFNNAEAQAAMAGDPQVLDMFQRRAAPFLSGGNKQMAQGSALGNNRLVNSIFAFQMYPMLRMNQLRKTAVNWLDAERMGTPAEKNAARLQLGKYLFNTTLQGAVQVMLASFVFGGPSGVKIKANEANDEKGKFLLESFLAAQSGLLYYLWRGLKKHGAVGRGEQAARMAFPYAMASDFSDMANGDGPYRDQDTMQKIGKFLKQKTPAAAAVGTALAMFGLGNESQPLDEAMKALYRWKIENNLAGGSGPIREDRAQFRNYVRKALEAMKDGDHDTFQQSWLDAVGENNVAGFAGSMRGRKVLAGLTDEQKEALQRRIGFDAYDRLDYYDIMLEAAAKGVMLEY